MANPYTRFAPTQYQSQYVPAPLEQIAPAMQYASGLRQESELADARTKKLVRDMLGSAQTPEEMAFVKEAEERAMTDITQRSKRGYSSQDAIEVELQAQETADALGSVATARESTQAWQDEMREVNRDRISDPAELEFWINQSTPEIEYDTENMRASVRTPGVIQLAEDINLAERGDDYLRGIKEKDFQNVEGGQYIERVRNPFTGQYEIQTSSGVDRDRIKNALDMAFRSDPEIQAYINRKEQFYTAQASQDPDGSLAAIMENAPEQALPQVQEKVKTLQDAGFNNAQIVGTLMANNEVANAQGFGQSKYAYTVYGDGFASEGRRNASSAANGVNTVLAGTRAMNNPMAASMPSGVSSLEQDIDREMGRLRAEMDKYGHSGELKDTANNQVIREQLKKLEQEKQIGMQIGDSLESYATSERGRESYGDLLEKLVNEFPKGNMNEENYRDFIDGKYKDRIEYMSSTRGNYHMYSDNDYQEAKTDEILIDRTSKRLGTIQQSTIYEVTQGSESEAMSVADLADMLGKDYQGEEFKEFLFENGNITGEFRGSDANIPSGYFLTIPESGSWLKDTNSRTREFKIATPDLQKQAIYEPMRKMTEFKYDPRKYEDTISINGTDIDFFAEDQYVNAKTNEPVGADHELAEYAGKRVGFYSEGKKYYEGSQEYIDLQNGIIGRNGQ